MAVQSNEDPKLKVIMTNDRNVQALGEPFFLKLQSLDAFWRDYYNNFSFDTLYGMNYECNEDNSFGLFILHIT